MTQTRTVEITLAILILVLVGLCAFAGGATIAITPGQSIQAAVNASAVGDTIIFSGTHTLTSKVLLKGGRTYTGQAGAKIINSTGDRVIFYISEDNITINKLTLEGQGIETNKPDGAMVAGLIVDNVIFNVTGGGHVCGIEFNTGLRNSRITNSTFFVGGENGIYGYYWDKLTIANNEFLNPPGGVGGEGIHIIDPAGSSKDLLVEQNYFSGLHRMGIEYQGGGINTIIQDNYYEKPIVYPTFNQNNDTFAYSIICDRSINTITRRNFARSYERADGVGCRIVFEIGGNNAICEDNYSDGGNHVVAVNGGSGAQVRNNRFTGYLQGPGVGGSGKNATFTNNGPNVALTWDINRGRPFPNKRYGAAPAPAFALVGEVQTSILSTGTARFTWSAMPAGATQIRLACRATGDNSITDSRVGPTALRPADAQPLTLEGFHPGWNVDVQAEALASDNGSLGKTAWITLTFPGDPNVKPWPPIIVPPATQPTDSLLTTIRVYQSGKVEATKP